MELRAKRFVMLTRGGVTVLATIVGISALWLVAFAGVARAATCATGPAQLTAVGQSCYTVPAGVSSVRVVAVGAQGGAGDGCGVGGFGAEVDGTLAVTPGGTLYAEVAGHGGPGDDLTGGAAGPNGGGGGGSGGGGGGLTGGGGGGGGATDVRLQPSSVSLGSADSRLLIAGGGGGSGGSNGDCGAGGAGGLFATAGGSTTFASGGRPGIASGGGTFGGSNGSCSSITVATSGALGNGGTGASSPTSNCGGGGGGGAGYFGGGGGGTDGTPGGSGGGAGSSFVNAALVANPSITTAIQATGMVSFIPVFGIVSVSPAGSRSFPGTQPMETLSSPMSVTITDAGSGPLQISSLTFAGTDPQDFLITSNGCIGQLAAGASCTLGVSFAPQAQGARSASLQIASNAQGSPAAVPLSGTGGQLPQGARGATGATGATGNAGKIELVVCTKTTKTTTKNGKKRKITVQHCTTKLVSGTVKFTINSNISAAVSRGAVTYATGLAIPTGTGRWQLILTHRQHSLRPGRYTLTLKSHHGHRRNVKRSVITIT